MNHENKTKTTEAKKTTNNESNLGFKKGMLGKSVSKEQANIRKGKGDKKKNKSTPPKKRNNVFQKGVDGQKEKNNNGILKGTTKGKQKKDRIGRKEGFWRQAFWGNTLKKPLKISQTSLFGPFHKRIAQKHRKEKTKPPKKAKSRQKEAFLHFGKQPSIFR